MDALPRHHRIVIALSVHILRGGVARTASGRVDGVDVRLALRCLLPHCPERWPLELYWDAAGQENEIGRSQGVTAAFNGIVRQLRRAGRYEEAPAVTATPSTAAQPVEDRTSRNAETVAVERDTSPASRCDADSHSEPSRQRQ